MNSATPLLSSWQQGMVVLLRFSIGWHLFYQGFGKIYAVSWTSREYLEAASGPLAGVFQGIARSPALLSLADTLTVWGLIVAGLLLMAGLFSRAAALVGLLLLTLFYVAAPPLGYAGFIVATAQGTELYVNKTLIEAIALLMLLSFPTGHILGLDIWVKGWRAAGRTSGWERQQSNG